MNSYQQHLGLKGFGLMVVIGVLLFGSISVTGVTAQSAIPGDTLYPVKTTIEQTRLSLASDAGARAQMKMGFAEQRLEEIAALIEEGRFREVGEAVLGFEAEIHSAILELETVSQTDPARGAQIALEITAALTRYAQTLSSMAATAPQSVRPEVTRALDTTQIASSLELPAVDPASSNDNINANNNGDDENTNTNDDSSNTNGDDGNANTNDNANTNSNTDDSNDNMNGDDSNSNGDDRGNSNGDDSNANSNGDDSNANSNGDDGSVNSNGDDTGNTNGDDSSTNTNGDDSNSNGSVDNGNANDDNGGNTNGNDDTTNNNDSSTNDSGDDHGGDSGKGGGNDNSDDNGNDSGNSGHGGLVINRLVVMFRTIRSVMGSL